VVEALMGRAVEGAVLQLVYVRTKVPEPVFLLVASTTILLNAAKTGSSFDVPPRVDADRIETVFEEEDEPRNQLVFFTI
jgi:hypothetical protein